MDLQAKRDSVIALYLGKKSTSAIVRELRHLNVNRIFVYRTIKRYQDTGTVNKKYGGGRRPTATSATNVRKVRSKLARNPRRSGNAMAKEVGVSVASMHRILRNKLMVKPFKIQKVQDLTVAQKKMRHQRSKALKQRLVCGDLKNCVFTDEKVFTVQQFVNKQNDRVWLTERSAINMDQLRAYRRQKPASVMVWAGVTENGRTPLVFVPAGVKINATTYQELVLEACVKPWAAKNFKKDRWVFQQDSAPAHKAKTTQRWLQENVPAFISTTDWPSCSPDLNPMDFSIWGILESKVCNKKYDSVEVLKRALVREWNKIPQSVIRAACNAFADRLDTVILFKGGHIEN